MAEVTFSREPVVAPPVTFTLTLSEDEARALDAVINGETYAEIGELRADNEEHIYEIIDALQAALAKSRAAD